MKKKYIELIAKLWYIFAVVSRVASFTDGECKKLIWTISIYYCRLSHTRHELILKINSKYSHWHITPKLSAIRGL